MNTYKVTLEIADDFNIYATKEQLEAAFIDLLRINCASLNLSITSTQITKKKG
jgi:hypothetical protein